MNYNVEYYRKALLLERQAKRDEKSSSLEDLKILKKNNRILEKSRKFTYRKCLLETFIIGINYK